MVTINASRDAYVFEYYPTYNMGTCALGRLGYFISKEYRSFFYFDTTGINISKTKCIFKLTLVNLYVGTPNLTIERLTSTFNEGTKCVAAESSVITWNNQPTATASNSVTFDFDSTGVRYIDLTDMFRDSSSNWFAFRIRPTSFSSGDNGQCGLKEYGSSTMPQIIVNEVGYVKTSGNDLNDGRTWENAWATIDKAANTVIDGSEVQIEAGTYTEVAGDVIAPVNAGATGIKYIIWGTAGTGTNDGISTGGGPWDAKIIPAN